MSKKKMDIKVHEHKHVAKGQSQYDIWIDDKCRVDINNVQGFINIHNLTNNEQWKEIEKLVKKYFINSKSK